VLPILQIGRLAIQLPGLLLLAGIWWGMTMVEREARRQALPDNLYTSMVVYGLLAGIVGARLGYALQFLQIYLREPLSLFSLNINTLAPREGFIAALLVSFVFAHRKRLPLWATLDAFMLGLAAFNICYGLSHLSSGDAFGAPSSVSWAIELWGARRHPTQVYEILLAVLSLLILQMLKTRSPFQGFSFFAGLGWMAVSRLFLEAFRGDSIVVLGGVRSVQVVSLGFIIVALLGIHLLARRIATGKEYLT
jgi:phosphatidylglycerol:prolipoprotein diacylglycerol transferase